MSDILPLAVEIVLLIILSGMVFVLLYLRRRINVERIEYLRQLEDLENKKNYLTDAGLKLLELKEALERECGIECRACVVGYVQRGGAPSVMDRLLAIQLGINAIEQIHKGVYNIALGVRNNNIFYMKLEEVYALKDEFNKLLYRQLRNLHNLK